MKELWQRCIEVQDTAAREGFDWPGPQQVIDKLHEELDELAAAGSPAQQLEEFGDVLFALTNLARHLDIDAEAALAGALRKFKTRYRAVMAEPETLPPLGDPLRLEAMEARWQRAKSDGKGGG